MDREIQKQGHYTCPNCASEFWLWARKDPNFQMPEKERVFRTCGRCFGANRADTEAPNELGKSQIPIGRNGKFWVYDICPDCAGNGYIEVVTS